MIINRGNGEIAEWWYEGKKIENLVFSIEDCVTLLEVISKTVKILSEAELLYPKTIHIKGWARYDFNKSKLMRENKEGLSLQIEPKDFKDTLFSLFNFKEKSTFLYPLEIEICGNGVIYNKANERMVWSDIIAVCGQTLTQHVIDVTTYSYAWLPYDLQGNMQDEICHYNAPRLEKALRSIQNHTGFFLIDESSSEYALINKYKLSNHIDADGEIITFEIK